MKPGNVLEMAYIERRDIEAEMQGRRANNQAFHGDGNAPGRLLALDPPRNLRDLQ